MLVVYKRNLHGDVRTYEEEEMKTQREQIEEMAKQMCGAIDNSCIHDCTPACGAREYAKRCFKAGYRKQSDTVKEFVCKVLQIGSKRPLCLFNEYKEGYTDCLDQIKELAAQYGVEVEQ